MLEVEPTVQRGRNDREAKKSRRQYPGKQAR